jgi:hypothetical protein
MRAKHLPSDPALSGIAFGLGPDARTSVVFPGAANDNRRRA